VQFFDDPALSKLVGKEVVLHGYLGDRVDISKKLSFSKFFDSSLNNSIQIVSARSGNAEERTSNSHEKLKQLTTNTPISVHGTLQERDEKAASSERTSINNLELRLSSIQQLNSWPSDIIVTKDVRFPPEKRNLQIRTDSSLRQSLQFRAKVVRMCRNYLDDEKFLEVETPILFKSTPEGAREFLVPTRRKGLAYALPQSPQQYKQILMASGIPRYYQFARCFRDEDNRADRQPEFTQLDMEMSFTSPEGLMTYIEDLLRILFDKLLGIKLPDSFMRLTYEEAMTTYGIDKPDLRFDTKIHNVTQIVPQSLVSMITSDMQSRIELAKFRVSSDPKTTKTVLGDFLDLAESRAFHDNPHGGPGVFVFNSKQPINGLQSFGFEAAEKIESLLGLSDGDLIIAQARPQAPHSGGSTALGRIIVAFNNYAKEKGLLKPKSAFEFVWVNDFPLFSPATVSEPGQGGTAGFSSTHHPFTSPKRSEDFDQLLVDPLSVVGDHYDIVLNGVELGGGSRRIHIAEFQEFVLKNILQIPVDRLSEFSHLLEALRAGCPPHCGIALGLDRLVAVMLGKTSVRDVIAFPKSGRGEDMLVNSPSTISKEALGTYHLRLDD
jgi:aspartyl-tRNA synthetase